MTRQQDSEAPGMPVETVETVDLPGPMTPGVTVGGGRYRLLEQVGADPRVEAVFWRARDSALDRDVAVTTLTGVGGPRSAQAALSAGRLEHPAVARILDVLTDPKQAGPGLTGLIITEWIEGADLATLSTDATKVGRTLPTAMIARALSPLASLVDSAHRAGQVLGADHPQKIRIGGDGLARLAFPVASASGAPTDDVRGLGAAIYLLLTGRWPLPGPPAGLLAAPASATGVALPAQSLRPAASATLATLAQRCLAGTAANGVYTGAAVHQLLEQVMNAEADTMMLTPLPAGDDGGWSGVAGGDTSLDRADHYGADDRADRDRRRKLAISLAVLGLALLVVFVWVGTQVADFFAGDSTAGPTVVVSRPGEPRQPGSGQPAPAQPAPAGPIQAAGIQVFNIAGDPDNPNRANRAVDGNPRTSWKTYDYNQPFPALKPGVGVVVSFAEAVTLAAVQFDSPSAGTTIEIRTAPPSGSTLDGTTVLGSGTLTEGRTEIRLTQPEPSQRILVWITGLSTRGGKNATELAELIFLRTA